MTYAQPGQEGSVEISYTLKCEEPLYFRRLEAQYFSIKLLDA